MLFYAVEMIAVNKNSISVQGNVNIATLWIFLALSNFSSSNYSAVLLVIMRIRKFAEKFATVIRKNSANKVSFFMWKFKFYQLVQLTIKGFFESLALSSPGIENRNVDLIVILRSTVSLKLSPNLGNFMEFISEQQSLLQGGMTKIYPSPSSIIQRLASDKKNSANKSMLEC